MATGRQMRQPQKAAQKKEETQKQTWNSIQGDIRVWGKKFGDRMAFSTTVSSKNRDGEWINEYLNLKFASGCGSPDQEGESWITIKNGFLVPGYNQGTIELIVTDWDWVK